MNLPFRIAKRYLFGKKSFNAINIITSISVFGLALGTAALLLILSVFNGFEDLISGMIGKFNPDVKVSLLKGKTFKADTAQIAALRRVQGVLEIAQTLEESALFEYNKSQAFGIVKGVDKHFQQVNPVDSAVVQGKFALGDEEKSYSVVGGGLYGQLGISVDNQIIPLSVYMPKRGEVNALELPFNKRLTYPSGAFIIQQDFDNQYVITDLEFVQDILNAPEELSALEIKLQKGISLKPILKQIQQIMGTKFAVKDRLQQDAALMKLMNMEKWLAYSIVSLTLLLIGFNMVGTLWLMVLEKQQDITVLRAMGAEDRLIRGIFLNEGFLLCLMGILVGTVLAIGLNLLHQALPNGLIPLAEGFIQRYPVSMRLGDFPIVALTVIIIGGLAAMPAAMRAQRIGATMNI
jgi:lipoprotein-releasing system permease protein